MKRENLYQLLGISFDAFDDFLLKEHDLYCDMQPSTGMYSKEIIIQLFNILILVIVWNIVVLLPEQVYKCSEEKSLQILQYIQSNIYSLIKSK